MASGIEPQTPMTGEPRPGSLDTRFAETLAFSSLDFEIERPEPYSSLVRVECDAISHPGNARSNNEDAFLVYRTSRSWERLLTNLPEADLPERFSEMAYVFCVADGMGGVAAGDVASSLALRTGVNLVLNSVKWSLKLDHPQSRQQEVREVIARALDRFRRINTTLVERGARRSSQFGMGTTLTVAGSFGADLFIFHVGDSRAYLLRKGVLEQLTKDQTVTQVLVDSGQITADQAREHRMRHVLTGVLGGKGDADTPEVQKLHLEDGDHLLLCTDGLTEMMEDTAIAEVITQAESVADACRRLLDEALKRGGKDNVTVVLARYLLPGEQSQT